MKTPSGRIWVDDRPPDPAWSPPGLGGADGSTPPPVAPHPERTRRWRPHPVLLGALAVGLVVVVIWAAGGFATRTDLRIPTAAGQVITTGPYEFTFSTATAQRKTRYSGETEVEVTVVGTGRTTGEKAVAPSYTNSMFVAKDDAGGEIQEASSQRFGSEANVDNGSHFTPGLPPIDYRLVFEFSGKYQPGATLRFAVSELEFSDASLLGTGEKLWNNGERNFVLLLPVTRLPDEE